MQPFAGVFCALWTPSDERGDILWDALDRHLPFLFQHGIAGLMALGSTAEFLHLDLGQRKSLLRYLCAACKKHGARMIANVSDVQIRNVVELASCARDEGADAIAVLPPWYFPYEQRDLVEFFVRAAAKTEMPLVVYNYPEVTGKKVELETIRAVAGRVRVVAVKQSGGDYEYHRGLLDLGRQLRFEVLTGSDTRFAETLQLGCSGTISGLANCVPEWLCRIYQNTRANRASSAETNNISALAQEIRPLLFPLNVKAAVQARGFETGQEKMPVSSETKNLYEKTVRCLAGFYEEAGLPPQNSASS